MDIGVAQRPAAGEKVCGDSCLILKDRSLTLISVIDGAGHGAKAADAAQCMCETLRGLPLDEDLEDILEHCNSSLRYTRGASAVVTRIDGTGNVFEFTGVGNIELKAISRDPISPVCMPGLLGVRVRRYRTFRYELHENDIIVMSTDGIFEQFDLRDYRFGSAQDMADRILSDNMKNHDDATCLAIRYLPFNAG